MGIIDKFFNRNYGSTVPETSGDRLYAQDIQRDALYVEQCMGQHAVDVHWGTGGIISGADAFAVIASMGNWTVLSTNTIQVMPGSGYHGRQVEIMDDFNLSPPSKKSVVKQYQRVQWPMTAVNLATAGWVNDNVTVNYLKIRYKELDGNTRQRAKASGTYAFEKIPSYEIYVDQTAPDGKSLCLFSFVTVGGLISANHTWGLADRSQRVMTFPIGGVVASASAALQSGYFGWLPCEGGTFLPCVYPDLAKLWGSPLYGTTVILGTTYWKLPDYRGQFLRGQDNGAGVDPYKTTRTNRGDGTTGDQVGTKQPFHTGDSKEVEESVTGMRGYTGHAGVHDHAFTMYNGPYDGFNSGAAVDKYFDSTRFAVTSSAGSHNHYFKVGNFDSETAPININVRWYIRGY